MDRRTALDLLELVRSDATDLHNPELAEALAYLETDEPASEEFARRRLHDRQIAQAMRDVPVPVDLKQRLLASLNDPPASATPGEASPLKSRRRWMVSAVVVLASCLLAAVGIWFFQNTAPAQLMLQELQVIAPFEEQDIARLNTFSGRFEPALPEGLWRSERRIAFSTPPKGFAPARSGQDRVAVYEFHFRDPRDRHPGILRGVMLVVPKANLQTVPESQSFFDGAYTTHQAKPGLAIQSWTEQDRVYVCFVPIAHYEALSQTLESPPA